MNLFNSVEEVKENNNKKFNDTKEQILIIQKTLDDESQKRESSHQEFMEFLIVVFIPKISRHRITPISKIRLLTNFMRRL